MGANGFLVRSGAIQNRAGASGDYYFDIDVVNELVELGHRRIAKVDIALGHHFVHNLSSLRRKVRRRAEDFLYWRDRRTYPWFSSRKLPIVRFVLYTILIVPLLFQAFRGWLRVHDTAWLYHVPVCWITLGLYGSAVIRAAVRNAPHSRKGWQQ